MTAQPSYLNSYTFPAEKTTTHLQFTINDIHNNDRYYNAVAPHLAQHNFEIFLIKKGGGFHVIDDTSYAIEDRSVHILQPDVTHYLHCNDNTKGQVITFSMDVLNGDNSIITGSLINFFGSMLAQPTAILSTRSFIELQTILRLMNTSKMVRRGAIEQNTYVRSLFSAFLLTIKPHFAIGHKAETSDSQTMVNKFYELVDQFYHDGLPIGDYASRLGTTEKTLTRALKKHRETTPAKVIRERVIVEASKMLHDTHHSIKEIAYHLHFSDPAHFVKVFRADKGMTPMEYRRSVHF